MPKSQEKQITQMLTSGAYGGPHFLLAALEDIHALFGRLPDHGLDIVARHFGIPRHDVEAFVAQCAEAFTPKDSHHRMRICMGPICSKVGGEQLLRVAQSHGRDAVPGLCMGACDHAPVGRVGKRLIADAAPEDFQ